MDFLLDVNVLIARADSRHEHHARSHRFLPADLTVAHAPTFGDLRGVSPKQLADLYLLAVASRHGVRFATLDEAVPATLIAGGPAALHVIPPEGA